MVRFALIFVALCGSALGVIADQQEARDKNMNSFQARQMEKRSGDVHHGMALPGRFEIKSERNETLKIDTGTGDVWVLDEENAWVKIEFGERGPRNREENDKNIAILEKVLD